MLISQLPRYSTPLACISRTRHARSPQRVARAPGTSHSRLHFAPSTRTISAEGCAQTIQIALSPAFRALDAHDLRRGSRGHLANRTLACISRTRHARSPQRVARAPGTSHSRLHFAHSTRAISAEGRARSRQNRTLACISRTRRARSPQRVARAAGKSHSRLRFAHSTRTISAEGCARSRQIAMCQCLGVSKCKCRSVSVQRIFRKNPSQCFRESRVWQAIVPGTQNKPQDTLQIRKTPWHGVTKQPPAVPLPGPNVTPEPNEKIKGLAGNCSRHTK